MKKFNYIDWVTKNKHGKTLKEIMAIPDDTTFRLAAKGFARKSDPSDNWNNLNVKEDHLPTFSELNNLDFYHVHTYYFDVFNKKDVIATVDYGIEIPSFIQRDNVFGAQFHPEKSQKNGIKFLNYFLNS